MEFRPISVVLVLVLVIISSGCMGSGESENPGPGVSEGKELVEEGNRLVYDTEDGNVTF